MEKTINQLIQLQELTIARDQQEASDSSAHIEGLNKSIRTMLDELPEDIASLFQRLQKRDGLAIVPVSDRTCTGCAMGLPASLVQTIRQAQELKTCPTCARILYVSDRVIRKKPQPSGGGRYASQKAGLERFSNVDLMIPNLEAKTVEDVIRACAGKLEEHQFIDDANVLAEEGLKREAIASTAVDNGLAFPHVRGVEGGGLSMVVAVSPEGVDFGHPDGEKSHIFFFITIPSAASAFYLKLLAGLTRAFRNKAPVEKLLACDTEKKMWKALLQATRKTIT